jgi:hypothetical protein
MGVRKVLGEVFMLIVIMLVLALISTQAYAQAPQIERIDIVDHGIYSATILSAQRDTQGILQSQSTDIQLVKITNEVPAQIGVRFGFRFKAAGEPIGSRVSLKKITIFPPAGLQNPNSPETISRSESTVTTTLGDEVNYTAYKFDDSWELVTGIWTIKLWDNDRKLASQEFMVFKP